mmetsp:Transcript_120149/g.285476  ORF Transcript_120149/g.285476 Transcript_120149/m.285476 type:complete len:344 (+) Transcript_120149:88-1119(+)
MAPIPWEEADPFSISMYAQESTYWASLQESDTLMRVCRELSAGRSSEAVESSIEQLCKMCWAEALEAIDSHTLLIAARAEVDHLKRRLAKCSFQSVKQILDEDEITEKRLHIDAVDLKQLDQDQTEKHLEKLCKDAATPRGTGTQEIGVNTEGDEVEVRQRCEDLTARLGRSEAQNAELRRRQRRLEEQLAESSEELHRTQERLDEAVERLEESESTKVVLEGAYEKLQEDHEFELKAGEDARQEVSRLQTEVHRLREDRKASRRPSRRPDSRPPSSPLPLLQGPLSYSEAASLEESPGFTVNRKKAMQVSTSLPSLASKGESAGLAQSGSSILPRSKRPFVM